MSPSDAAVQQSAGPSDAALVVSARAGEAWAREALFRRYARMVNRLAFRLMGRDADLDDLVQESFLQALHSLDRLAAPQAFASWLASIVVRQAHKVLRRRRLMSRLGLRTRDSIDLDSLIGAGTPPDAASEIRMIYRCIERLPPKLRIPLVLRRIEGLPLEEIAQMTDTSLATTKRRLAEAQRMLDDAPISLGAKGDR